MTADAPPPSPSAFTEPNEAPEIVAVTTAKVPPENVVQKRGGSGYSSKRGGSGLPTLHNIQWEQKTDRPGFAAWNAPQGNNAPRNTKTYLGYVGKRLLAEWLAMPMDERRAVIAQWVADRRKEKGIG